MSFIPTGRVNLKYSKKNGYTWYAIVNLKKDENGNYPQRFINTHLPERGNKKKAEQILAFELEKYKKELEEEERKNSLTVYGIESMDGSKIKFLDYLQQYIDYNKIHWRQSTCEGHQFTLKKISNYFKSKKLDLNLSDINHIIINNMYNKFQQDKLKVKTIDNMANLIRPALKQAYIDDIISCNPYDKVAKLKKQPNVDIDIERPYLNDEQMKEFIKIVSNHRLGAIYIICLMTGTRRSELAGLKWSHINFENRRIHIKGNVQKHKGVFEFSDLNKTEQSEDEQIISDFVFQTLSFIKEDKEKNKKLWGNAYNSTYDDYVCVNELGELYNPGYLTSELKKIVRAHPELPDIHLHSLRHSFCTYVYNQTGDIYLTMLMMRHSRVETTKIYTHANREYGKKEKVANFFQNSFGELQDLLKENICNQEKTNNDKN